MPDDDRQEPELQPKLDTSGAGARKGGGRGGPKMLPPGRDGLVQRNGLNEAEAAFAADVVAFRGGLFIGASKAAPGIDGTLDGRMVSLKHTSIGGMRGLNRELGRAEASAAAAGFSGIDLYIIAPALTRNEITSWGTAHNAPLSRAPGRGVIGNVFIQAADGLGAVRRLMMGQDLVVRMENSPLVGDVLSEVIRVLSEHVEEVPPVMYDDRPVDYWLDVDSRTVDRTDGYVSLLADDAVVQLSEFVDEEGALWVTVDGGIWRTPQSLQLMAVVGLALYRLGALEVENPFQALGLGVHVDQRSLQSWVRQSLKTRVVGEQQ